MGVEEDIWTVLGGQVRGYGQTEGHGRQEHRCLPMRNRELMMAVAMGVVGDGNGRWGDGDVRGHGGAVMVIVDGWW